MKSRQEQEPAEARNSALRVACLQMNSGDDVAANLATAARLLEEAAKAKVRLALLPENFSFMGADTERKRQIAAGEAPRRILPFLAEQARRHALTLVGGSLLLSAADGRLRNACPVFAADGSRLGIYDKIHLFDADLSDQPYRESDLVAAGATPLCLEINDWRLGLSICYDLRFPELYRHYAAAGCHLLAVPSAFTVPTGGAHWEVLLRARAIENQAYVLAPAQFGTHPGNRRTYGHSMIVDPWGVVIARAQNQTPAGGELIVADIDLGRVREVRKQLPALSHRRL